MLATPERMSDEVNLARWHTERVLIGQGRGDVGVGVGHNVVFSLTMLGTTDPKVLKIYSFIHLNIY